MLDTNTFAKIYARLTHEMRLQLPRKRHEKQSQNNIHIVIYTWHDAK